MAMLDDNGFLIAHIRNSFITSDDTGMCELIVENDELTSTVLDKERNMTYSERKLTSWPYPSTKEEKRARAVCSFTTRDFDERLSLSADILPDMELGGHRRRSDTAQRLDKLKRERDKNSQIKRILWKNVQNTSDFGDIFAAKPHPEDPLIREDMTLSTQNSSMPVKKSALSLQLEEFDKVPNNPFIDYAKFDGRPAGGVPSKQIDIYLTMVTGKERSYPMTVSVLSSATVHNLIGLICWQYTNENREPPLRDNTDNYSLYMVEDDGEVDMDFPPLEKREPISKFGFTKLALVETSVKDTTLSHQKHNSIVIQVPSQGSVTLNIDSYSILIKDILELALAKRKLPSRKGFQYRLEKFSVPGVAVDAELPLSAVNCKEFVLIRENSARDTFLDELPDENVFKFAETLGSLNYQCFTVYMLHRFKQSLQVRIGVSGEKVEIYPTSLYSSPFVAKHKAYSFGISEIADCQLLEERKSTGKAIFRLTYIKTGCFKQKDFLTDQQTARELVAKLLNILTLNLTSVRAEYLQLKKERPGKLVRKHTLNLI